MEQFSVVGKEIARVDALEKVTGSAKYTGDFKETGLLYAKVLRSPYAHARIVSIDSSRAEKLPGVRAVVKPEDAPARRIGYITSADRQILPHDRVVRFVGEPVAIVVADSSEIAEEGLELIEVEYEELPTCFEAEKSLAKEPPVAIHPDKMSYPSAPTVFGCVPAPDLPNVATVFKIRRGDVAKGFQEADLIVENTYAFDRGQHCRLEPYVVDAWVETDGTLTVRTARTGIWRCHAWLCTVFGLPSSKVRVMSPYVGGHFGGKGTPVVEGLALLAAIKTGRRVRLEYSREEEFIDTGQRPEITIQVKDGVKKDGTLTARELKAVVDVGAYAAAGTSGSVFAVLKGIISCYNIPNWKSDCYSVYTNNPPTGTMRGVEGPQGCWASECNLDAIAHKLGIDPIELRKKNLVREGDANIMGEVLHHIHPRECLEAVGELIEWGNRPTSEGVWKRGKGVALANYWAGPAWPSAARVKVLRDGTLEVRIGTDEHGQGLMTIMSQLVAEEFKVSPNKVRVVRGDTLNTPWDWASIASRSTWFTGNAVVRACRNAKEQLFKVAASRLQVSPEELDTAEGRVYLKAAPQRGIAIAELFTWDLVHEQGEIEARGEYHYYPAEVDPETGYCPRVSPVWPYLAYGVQVAVNIETGEVKVEKVACAVDIGQPINWKLCEGQIEGGMGMGIGSALYERIVLDQGITLNPTFVDYCIPTATEVPSASNVKSVAVDSFHPDGPYGAKPLGEMTLLPFAAAIGNAVYDATGVRISHAPLTRERVLPALRAAGIT